jgi:hypothetical protein
LPDATVTFTWTANSSGATSYWLDVGNSLGLGDIYGANQGTALSTTVIGLPCDGRTIYVRLWGYITNTWKFTDYTYRARNGGCTVSNDSLASPVPGSVLPGGAVTFSWNNIASSTHWLDVGNSVGLGDLSAGRIDGATSKQVTGLPCDNRNIYVRFWTLLGGTNWVPLDYTYKASGPGGAGCVTPAAMVSPIPGTALAGTYVLFTWNSASGADAYWLDVGNNPGTGDISGGSLSTTSKVVTNIPADGRNIYVRLWTHFPSANWVYNDYIYKACSGPGCGSDPRATMIGPAPGSAFTSTSVTFTWTPGVGATAYWLDVGYSLGLGNISAGSTSLTSKTVSGLPASGHVPIYVRLWTYIGGWLTPFDYAYSSL